jgi:hypothetical protein
MNKSEFMKLREFIRGNGIRYASRIFPHHWEVFEILSALEGKTDFLMLRMKWNAQGIESKDTVIRLTSPILERK